MSKILTDKALGNVVYYGGKQLAEIPPLLQKAAVCIYPSINETFGLVYAEAMAMKKVVIASNNLVVNEIIKHQENGFIANDIDDYINYINLIFTDEKLKTSISENARIEVINRFDKVLTAKNTLKFYNEILQR
jgi:glycosyltransferase involved in cell wall biosynthesis